MVGRRKQMDQYKSNDKSTKTIQKKGLGKYAKSLGVDLNKL